jgi:hypothetical protein
MKRNFLFIGIFVACIATVSAYNVMLSISKSKHAMQLVRLSALADSESGSGSEQGTTVNSFVFDGTTWTSEKKWYNFLGADYRPVLIECTGTQTSAKVTLGFTASYKGTGVSVSGSIGGNQSSTWKGKQVQCQRGDGNCRNGTKCIGNPV